jgi:hypothetical protein
MSSLHRDKGGFLTLYHIHFQLAKEKSVEPTLILRAAPQSTSLVVIL